LLLEDIGNIHFRGNMLNVLIIGIGNAGTEYLIPSTKKRLGEAPWQNIMVPEI